MLFFARRLTNAAPTAEILVPARGFIVSFGFVRVAGSSEQLTVAVSKSSSALAIEDEVLRRSQSLAVGAGHKLFELNSGVVGGPPFEANSGIPFALSQNQDRLYVRAASATAPWTADVSIIVAPVIYP